MHSELPGKFEIISWFVFVVFFALKRFLIDVFLSIEGTSEKAREKLQEQTGTLYPDAWNTELGTKAFTREMQKQCYILGYLIFCFAGFVNKMRSRFCLDTAKIQMIFFSTNQDITFHSMYNHQHLEAISLAGMEKNGFSSYSLRHCTALPIPYSIHRNLY